MSDEENLDLEKLDEEIERENKVEKRIKDLSEKVKLAATERDEERKLREEQARKIAELERENAFNSGFADILAAHPAAKDHKDEIKTKSLAGYTVEDATYAVLGRAGKIAQSQPRAEVNSPIGGSAVTQPVTGGMKPVHEMTRDEKLNALREAEARGDIGLT